MNNYNLTKWSVIIAWSLLNVFLCDVVFHWNFNTLVFGQFSGAALVFIIMYLKNRKDEEE